MRFIRLFCFSLVVSSGVLLAEDVDVAITGALRWRNKWVERMPTRVREVKCRTTHFEKASLAYCEPGMITMRIDATTSGQSRVTWLSASVLSPEEALDEFVGNSKPGRQIGNPTTVTILTKDVRSCPKIDWDRTVHLASHLPELKEAHLDMAWTIRYPLVCAGDPFYVVYYSKGGLLRIDEFELTEFDAEPRWWYDSSSRARPVPLVARRNVNDGPWYRVVEPEPPR